MDKVKINLVSGSSIEKPLVTAFKNNNATYIVLDNEINGTMGLPIILVSKLENNKLVKINDQNEWGIVKETLRTIIAGNQVDYVSIEPSLPADDMFFSQLTLPVASFDALKNNYHPNIETSLSNENLDSLGPINVENSSNVSESLISPVMPAAQNVTMGVDEPVKNEGLDQSSMVSPIMPNSPASAQTVAPVTEVNMEPASSPQPMPNPTPAVEPIPEVKEESKIPVDFTADKEAFLKACENMFDALVAKFNNK